MTCLTYKERLQPQYAQSAAPKVPKLLHGVPSLCSSAIYTLDKLEKSSRYSMTAIKAHEIAWRDPGLPAEETPSLLSCSAVISNDVHPSGRWGGHPQPTQWKPLTAWQAIFHAYLDNIRHKRKFYSGRQMAEIPPHMALRWLNIFGGRFERNLAILLYPQVCLSLQ